MAKLLGLAWEKMVLHQINGENKVDKRDGNKRGEKDKGESELEREKTTI